MPSIVTAFLYPKGDLLYEVPSSGRLAQSIMFRALSTFDPELPMRVHVDGLGVPYSTSRITTAERNIKGVVARVPKGDHMRMTVKLLRDEFVKPYVEGLYNMNLEINGVEVDIGEVKIGTRSYEELFLSSPVAKGVTLRLMTQTIFDDETFPPELPVVLRRPMEAWNSNAPSHLRIPNEVLRRFYWAEPTIPCWLESGAVQIWFGTQRVVRIGYIGKLSYRFTRLDSFSGRVVSALLRFAEFSGIGRRTTMGFGVVKTHLWRSRSKSSSHVGSKGIKR